MFREYKLKLIPLNISKQDFQNNIQIITQTFFIHKLTNVIANSRTNSHIAKIINQRYYDFTLSIG